MLLGSKIKLVNFTNDPQFVNSVEEEVKKSNNHFFKQAFEQAYLEFCLRQLNYDPFPQGGAVHISLFKTTSNE